MNEGLGDQLWRANSANASGALDLPAGPYSLVRDDRYRRAVVAALRHYRAVMEGSGLLSTVAATGDARIGRRA
jgi:hypothetical protein